VAGCGAAATVPAGGRRGLPSRVPHTLAAASAAFALRGHLALVLGDCGEDVHRQPVHAGHVGGDEVNPALHQVGDERHADRQPAELGDQQRRTAGAAHGERCGQADAVGLAPALHILELADDLRSHGPGVQLGGRALRIETKPGLPLLVGADAVIGVEGPCGSCDGTELPVWAVVPLLPCLTLSRPDGTTGRLHRHRAHGKRR